MGFRVKRLCGFSGLVAAFVGSSIDYESLEHVFGISLLSRLSPAATCSEQSGSLDS